MTSVSWTRSSARSGLPVIERAKALKLGISARSPSRKLASVCFGAIVFLLCERLQQLNEPVGNGLVHRLVEQGFELCADLFLDVLVQCGVDQAVVLLAGARCLTGGQGLLI